MMLAVGDAKAEGRHGLWRACWRRLVKENDLAHGEFGKWSESIGMDGSMVRKFIRIVDELDSGKRYTYTELGMNALYHIATLPPEEREAEHITSKGIKIRCN